MKRLTAVLLVLILVLLLPSGFADSFDESVKKSAAAFEQYQKSAKRSIYLRSLDANRDVIRELASGDERVVGKGIPPGIYRIFYLGTDSASVKITTGNILEEELEIANLIWDAEQLTEYDEHILVLSKGLKLSCATKALHELDVVWMVRLAGLE